MLSLSQNEMATEHDSGKPSWHDAVKIGLLTVISNFESLLGVIAQLTSRQEMPIERLASSKAQCQAVMEIAAAELKELEKTDLT